MEDFLTDGRTWLGMQPGTQLKLLRSLLVILLFLLMRSVVQRVIRRNITDVAQRYRWSRGFNTVTGVLIVLFLVPTWFSGLQSLATFAGILGAGLAVALHDTVANIAGFLFIVFRRPFEVGDRIEIDGAAGDVIDVRLFQFSLLEIGNWVDADQSTGRIMHVPNGKVLRERTASFTRGFEYIWHEIPVLVTFESDWKAAKAILEEIIGAESFMVGDEAARQVRQAASRYLIYAGKMTPIVYTSVRDSGILLTIRYMTKPKTRRGTEQQVWEQILERFEAHPQIDLAYPTIRYYDP
ncbi:MAG: mechanosensitive ion channel family protein [Myxococcota bacterium]